MENQSINRKPNYSPSFEIEVSVDFVFGIPMGK